MTDPTMRHVTIVLERRLAASPAQVYRAWTADRREWDIPEESWVLAESKDEVRVDGVQYSRFGPGDDPRFEARGRYIVVRPDRLLIVAGVMHQRGEPMTATMSTVEIVPDGDGTRMILTDQSAFFGWEREEDRQAGWGTSLDRLEAFLGRSGARR